MNKVPPAKHAKLPPMLLAASMQFGDDRAAHAWLPDRGDLRDRMPRVVSGNLHRSTDIMDGADQRISKYLTMRLIVNLSYCVPMAVGLWFIGVPGAIRWGMVLWTAGLIMSTPLTVCFLVIGRRLPRFQFLDVLLGSQPALDPPTRIYQRLLAGDVDEAIEMASQQCEGRHLVAFDNDVAIPVLRMATVDHSRVAKAEHRHRIVVGMDMLLAELAEQHPVPVPKARVDVMCIGGKWKIDKQSARRLAHVMGLPGWQADVCALEPVFADYLSGLDLKGAKVVCIAYFSPAPEVQARRLCRRLCRRWPAPKMLLAVIEGADQMSVDGTRTVPLELLAEDAKKQLRGAAERWQAEAERHDAPVPRHATHFSAWLPSPS